MTIHVPGRRLMHHVPLQFVKNKVEGHGKRNINAALSLTSMIDFLVVTVVFLLMTFSASGETAMPKGITLPAGKFTMDMLDAPIVSVTESGLILIDGAPSGKVSEDLMDANSASPQLQRIEELFNNLKQKHDTWKQVNVGKEFHGVVMLQIDEKVPAIAVKSVFQTAAFAGYPNVSFMVNDGRSGGGQEAKK